MPTNQADLFSTKGKYGFCKLFEPENPLFDIVFVHGLTGNRQTTWTHKNGKFWPLDLLPNDFQDARIMTFGYDADVVKVSKSASANTLRDHGKSLADDLTILRDGDKTKTRPIIFVVHSLGGLVVEQALLISRGSSETHAKDVLESSMAVAFMGTPHAGTDLANWGDIITRLSAVIRPTNKKIVRVLEPGSETLASIQQEFHTMLKDRNDNHGICLQIFCFHEDRSYGKFGKIVPDHSSILAGYPSASIPADHVDMTKFQDKDDVGYFRVKRRLNIWAEQIRGGISNTRDPAVDMIQQSTETQRLVPAQQPQQLNHLDINSLVSANRGSIHQGIFQSGNDMTLSHQS